MSENDCNRYFSTLKQNSICMDTIYTKLLKDGIESFKISFKDLLSKLIH